MTISFDPSPYTTARQQTEGLIQFVGPAEEVFERIANHAAMIDWVPLLKTVSITHPKPLPPGQSMIGTTRILTLRGGLTVREQIVDWHPPHYYAYTTEGKHWPTQNYLGLMGVEPSSRGGTFVFREYFDADGALRQALVPSGLVMLGKQALTNLSALIGGTSVQIRRVPTGDGE